MNRNNEKDELDNLMAERNKPRGWGEVSSINDDMINEIENILQNK
jgi:hypothetical protein